MRRFASIASGLFACVTGCGDDGVHHLPDAPPADDAGIDAPASGNANITTTVRCCTVAAGTPQAGVRVVVVRRDHTLGATAMTDALGKATVAVQAGDAVTAIYPQDANDTTDLTTIVGVKPGDNLTFGEGNYTLPSAGVGGQINASWPTVANTNNYYIYTPCGQEYGGDGTATSTVLSLYDTCQTPTAPIVFVAYGVTNNILASSYLPAAAFTPGTLPPITWTPLAGPNYALSVSGLDAAVSQVSFRATSVYPRDIQVTVDGNPTITAGAGSSNLSALASATRTFASMDLRRNGTEGRQRYFKAQPTSVAFTAGVPWINGFAVSAGDGHVVWLQGAGSYDAATFHFNWNRFDTSSHYYEWNVIMPPGVTTLDLGPPPAELAAYLPNSTDNVGTSLLLVDLASAADYDAVRALPESTVMDPEGAIRSGTITGVGMSGYDGGEGFTFAPRH